MTRTKGQSPVRFAVLKIANLRSRIDTRLRQIDPGMSLIYHPSIGQYQLHFASKEPDPFRIDELLGLWRVLGNGRDYDEDLTLVYGSPYMENHVRHEAKVYMEKPLSKSRHLEFFTTLEGAREQLRDGTWHPLQIDKRGVLDDAKLEASEAPQGATGKPAEPPEPDFDMPDFGGPLTELGSA